MQALKDQDCGIDGVSMKIHLEVNVHEDYTEILRKNIQEFAKLDLEVHLAQVVVECVLADDGSCDGHFTMAYEEE
jgi:hypothetical protein